MTLTQWQRRQLQARLILPPRNIKTKWKMSEPTSSELQKTVKSLQKPNKCWIRRKATWTQQEPFVAFLLLLTHPPLAQWHFALKAVTTSVPSVGPWPVSRSRTHLNHNQCVFLFTCARGLPKRRDQMLVSVPPHTELRLEKCRLNYWLRRLRQGQSGTAQYNCLSHGSKS